MQIRFFISHREQDTITPDMEKQLIQNQGFLKNPRRGTAHLFRYVIIKKKNKDSSICVCILGVQSHDQQLP